MGQPGKARQAGGLSLVFEAVDYLFQRFFVEKERPGPTEMSWRGEAGSAVVVAARGYEIDPAAAGTERALDAMESR